MRDKMRLSESRLLALQIAHLVCEHIGKQRHATHQPKQVWRHATISTTKEGSIKIDATIDNYPERFVITIGMTGASVETGHFLFTATATWPNARTFLVQGIVKRDFNGQFEAPTILSNLDGSDESLQARRLAIAGR